MAASTVLLCFTSELCGVGEEGLVGFGDAEGFVVFVSEVGESC